jgi:hypothetical protein
MTFNENFGDLRSLLATQPNLHWEWLDSLRILEKLADMTRTFPVQAQEVAIPYVQAKLPATYVYPAGRPELERDLPVSFVEALQKGTDWFSLYTDDKTECPAQSTNWEHVKHLEVLESTPTIESQALGKLNIGLGDFQLESLDLSQASAWLDSDQHTLTDLRKVLARGGFKYFGMMPQGFCAIPHYFTQMRPFFPSHVEHLLVTFSAFTAELLSYIRPSCETLAVVLDASRLSPLDNTATLYNYFRSIGETFQHYQAQNPNVAVTIYVSPQMKLAESAIRTLPGLAVNSQESVTRLGDLRRILT